MPSEGQGAPAEVRRPGRRRAGKPARYASSPSGPPRHSLSGRSGSSSEGPADAGDVSDYDPLV